MGSTLNDSNRRQYVRIFLLFKALPWWWFELGLENDGQCQTDMCLCVHPNKLENICTDNAPEISYRYREISQFPWHDNVIRGKVEWYKPLTMCTYIFANQSLVVMMIWTLAYKMEVKAKLLCAIVFARTSPGTLVPTMQLQFLTATDLLASFYHTTVSFGVNVAGFKPLTTSTCISAILSLFAMKI
jgi:hypothetical protein